MKVHALSLLTSLPPRGVSNLLPHPPPAWGVGGTDATAAAHAALAPLDVTHTTDQHQSHGLYLPCDGLDSRPSPCCRGGAAGCAATLAPEPAAQPMMPVLPPVGEFEGHVASVEEDVLEMMTGAETLCSLQWLSREQAAPLPSGCSGTTRQPSIRLQPSNAADHALAPPAPAPTPAEACVAVAPLRPALLPPLPEPGRLPPRLRQLEAEVVLDCQLAPQQMAAL